MTEEQVKPTMPEVELPELPDSDDDRIEIIETDEDSGADDPLAAERDALRAERDDFRDRFMRALADAENVRKRGERDRREAERYGGSRLARDILPVHDNLARALDAATLVLKAATEEQREATSGLVEGIELTMRELLNVFGKHGVERVSPERGDRFDPQIHQAMFEAPVPGTTAGDIIEVTEVGFTLHERLLRPAKVGVSSSPAQPSVPEKSEDAESEKEPTD